MSVRLYLFGRWLDARSKRARRKSHEWSELADKLKARAEKIFMRIGGQS